MECRGRFLSCGISSGRSVVRDFERDFKWNAVRDFMWDCGMSRGISSWISCGISCGGRPRGWSTPRIWVVAGCCWDVAVDTLASCLPRAFACRPIGARLSQLVIVLIARSPANPHRHSLHFSLTDAICGYMLSFVSVTNTSWTHGTATLLSPHSFP